LYRREEPPSACIEHAHPLTGLDVQVPVLMPRIMNRDRFVPEALSRGVEISVIAHSCCETVLRRCPTLEFSCGRSAQYAHCRSRLEDRNRRTTAMLGAPVSCNSC